MEFEGDPGKVSDRVVEDRVVEDRPRGIPPGIPPGMPEKKESSFIILNTDGPPPAPAKNEFP